MVDINQPVPGFYKTRIVRGGGFVPVRIFFAKKCWDGTIFPWDEANNDRGPCTLVAARDGKIVPMGAVWPHCARFRSTAAEYSKLLDDKDEAATTGADLADVQKIDLNTAPIPQF